MPATRGASGPTTVRSTLRRRATSSSPAMSVAATGTFSAIAAVPALPGATSTSAPSWVSFQAMACSRPPLPTTRTRRDVGTVQAPGRRDGELAIGTTDGGVDRCGHSATAAPRRARAPEYCVGCGCTEMSASADVADYGRDSHSPSTAGALFGWVRIEQPKRGFFAVPPRKPTLTVWGPQIQ